MNEKDELEFNKKNREDFEKIMEESSSKKDMYWDKNNPTVKLVLALVGMIILAGISYYIVKYFIH